MGLKKKIPFKLNPEWMFKEPIDFEYNKYTLLDYLQKCGKNFDNFEIYPDFVELSLHIANVQSLMKENVLLLTDKKFESFDDEILLKELYPKVPREISKEEERELEKTLKFSSSKLYDAFNIGKSIWSVAYENININLKKNKDVVVGSGFVVFHNKDENKNYVWEYQLNKPKKEISNYTLNLNLISETNEKKESFTTVIKNKSSWRNVDFLKKLPVFEVKCEKNLPLEQTIIPMVKRKILSYIFQTISPDKIKNFDIKE